MSAINVPSYVPVQYRQAVANASAKWNVPAEIIAAVIQTESGWNPDSPDMVDSYNSYGLGQFIPSTAASLGVNAHDPLSSIDGVGHLLHDNYQATGSWTDAIAAYNTGLGGIVNGQPTGNGPHYVSVVQSYMQNGVNGSGGSTVKLDSGTTAGASSDDTLNATTTADVQTASDPISGFIGSMFKPLFSILIDAGMIAAGIVAFLLGCFLMFREVR